jgi:hypothetical protein
MLTENQIKEQLSYAYIHAVAARAGFQCEPGPSPDMDSIDVLIRARGKVADDSTLYSPRLELQVKATETIPSMGEGSFSFQLKRKNYDDLRQRRACPAFLVVFLMPRERSEWLGQTPDSLVSRHAAYWCSLLGAPEIDADSRSISVPRQNILTPNSLKELMVRTSREEEIHFEA